MIFLQFLLKSYNRITIRPYSYHSVATSRYWPGLINRSYGFDSPPKRARCLELRVYHVMIQVDSEIVVGKKRCEKIVYKWLCFSGREVREWWHNTKWIITSFWQGLMNQYKLGWCTVLCCTWQIALCAVPAWKFPLALATISVEMTGYEGPITLTLRWAHVWHRFRLARWSSGPTTIVASATLLMRWWRLTETRY